MNAPSAAYEAARLEAAGQDRPRATPADAFRAARQTFLAGTRVDMTKLAAELGVAKATLYRWTGSREQLLGDVLWSLAEDTLDPVWRDTTALAGADRVVEAARRYITTLVQAPPLRRFVQEETHTAMRLLTSRGGPVQGRLVARLADLLRAEQDRADMTLRADPEALAFAIVRITEGFMYDDEPGDIAPAVDDAVAIVRLLVT